MVRERDMWIAGAAAAGAVGAIAGFAMANTPDAVPVEAGVSHIQARPYTYRDNACSVRADPINDIFVEAATATLVDTHAGHHGNWTNNDGSDQWFYVHSCRLMEQQAASGGGQSSRYHMRIIRGRTSSGATDTDSTWHTWSAADSHHEDYVLWPSCNIAPGSHAVDKNNSDSGGGFNQGRYDVYTNWVQNNGGHKWKRAENWNNTMRFTQCDGDVAYSDGTVDFIEVIG